MIYMIYLILIKSMIKLNQVETTFAYNKISSITLNYSFRVKSKF